MVRIEKGREKEVIRNVQTFTVPLTPAIAFEEHLYQKAINLK